MSELPIPPKAAGDKRATEVIRVWVAKKNLQVVLQPDLWEDAAAWGILLVDLAKHVANAFHETKGADFSETLQRIKEGFDAEWSEETSEATGEIEA